MTPPETYVAWQARYPGPASPRLTRVHPTHHHHHDHLATAYRTAPGAIYAALATVTALSPGHIPDADGALLALEESGDFDLHAGVSQAPVLSAWLPVTVT